MELDSALALPPEIANLDNMKSLNIQNEGLNRETNKECSLEAEIHSEKAKELTGEDLEGMERKEAKLISGVSEGTSRPLSSTTTSQLRAQKEPEFCPDEWQAQSDTTAQHPSVDTPHKIANFVPFAQEEPKSREEEWLCHWGDLRSRVALDSSRYATLFEEIERERALQPEGVDEELGTWIVQMDEQIRQSKELKSEMEALEEEYWEVDWLVKEKKCPTEIEFDGKREVEVASESDCSGEGSIPNTRESKVFAQSSTPSPTPPLDNAASAKNQPIFCFKEWNILFDTFRSRTSFLVSRSNALDQEINLIEPQSRTVDQLRSWIALMDEIIKERDVLKEEIVLYGEKVEERLRGLDVEASWRRGYEEALSRRIGGLQGILQFYEEEDLQRLEEEVEIRTRMNEVSDLAVSNTSNLIAPKRLYPYSPQTSLRTQRTKEITHNPPSDPNQRARKTNDSPFPQQSAPDPIDIALAETESSIIALLSTYRKAEISSLNSTLTAQSSPAQSDACASKQPAFLAAADETKRALEDYVRTMKEEEELRAMREIRGAIGNVTRNLYENSSTAKENEAIAAGGDERIPLADEENTPTTPIEAKVLIADEDEAIDAGRSKYASTSITARETPQHKALWPLAIPLVYVFLTLLVRGLFWIFSFLMAEAERERNPPRVVEAVHPCNLNWDSDFCPGW